MKQHVLIIAEAGVNHNGDTELARQLIRAAAEAGADFVKFQTFTPEKIVAPTARKAEYQQKNTGDEGDSQFAMLSKLAMPLEWYREMKTYAESVGIAFHSTAFDEESVDFLHQLGLPFFKVPSGEITNKPYLQHIASKGKPVILSTGMATLDEIREALDILTSGGIALSDITVLHCNTEYPTPMEDVNLLAMQQIGIELGVKTGYSDHTAGIEIPIAATALGAVVIEKHFTISRDLPGPDHKASLEPDELKTMVQAIRNVERALSGDGIKRPSPSEIRNIPIARRSLHFRSDLPAGHVLRREDFIALRPGDGISPMAIDRYIGAQLTVAVLALEQLNETHCA